MQAKRFNHLRQLQAIYRLSDEISRSAQPEGVYELALDALHASLPVDRSSILLIDSDGVMRFKASRGLSEEYRAATTGHSPWPADARDPAAVLVPDAASEPSLRPLLHVLKNEGIAALAFIPLINQRQLIGKFMLYSDQPRTFGEDEIALARTIANHVAFHIERSRFQSSLKDSEARRSGMLVAALDAVITIDHRGRVLEFNPAASEMFGFSQSEAVGREMAELIIPNRLRQRHRRGFKRFLETGEGSILGRRLEMIATRSDESEFPVELTVTQISSGDAPLFTGYVRDISERKKNEERQRFLAEAMGLLVASSLDYGRTLENLARLTVPRLADWCSIVLREGDASFRQVAVAAVDPVKQAVARRLEENYPLNPGVPYGVPNVLRTGRSEIYPEVAQSALASLARDDQSLRLLKQLGVASAMLVPLNARGRTLGVVTLIKSGSGRKYTEDDLQFVEDLAYRAALAVDNAKLYEDLKKASEAKDEFLGLVSHELRTPITTIVGGTRILQSPVIGQAEKAEMIADMRAESERLQRLVENLLVLARVELGEERSSEPTLAQRVLETEVASFAERSGRQVIVELEPELPPVQLSATSLEQILRNLLGNADKYSPKDQPVGVRAARTADHEVTVSVLDRGPGIPDEEAATIFERFYRSEQSPAKAGGLGLGLTVCKRLIAAQGGRISATPRVGGGLEIAFSLPIYTEEEAER